ncbi:MAG: flagellar hook protein FlgE [Halothiobacillaceae bacterium]
MSFNTSVSGLNAAQRDLNVTGNNIANSKSTGFKKSRAEFGDVYAVSAFGNSKTATGQGAQSQIVRQQFTQGNLEFTDSGLDLALSGEGFFVFSPGVNSSENLYSRSGALGVNKEGYLVNAQGQYLQGYPSDERGNIVGSTLDVAGPIRLPLDAGDPEATSQVDMGFNLSSDPEFPNLTPGDFDPADPATYTNSTSIKVFDTLGNGHILNFYFMKTAENEWQAEARLLPQGVEGSETGDYVVPSGGNFPATLTFDDSGRLNVDPPVFAGQLEFNGADLGTGAADLEIGVNFGTEDGAYNVTQFARPFNIVEQTQNGLAPGELTGLDIGDDGLVRASYSNGNFKNLAQVALADFRNPQALRQIGNNAWVETNDSGAPRSGVAGTDTFGLIQSGALEASNVDITEELVNLIVAQRNFQANARAIETNKQLSDTITNIR